MQHKIFRSIAALILVVAGVSCEKQGLDLYDDQTAKNDIYFLEKFNYAAGSNSADIMDNYRRRYISLGYTPLGVKDTVIAIYVRPTGGRASADRTYTVEVADSSTMKEGVHFEFLNKPFKIAAENTRDSILIKFHRSPDFQKDTLMLALHLKANENFGINFPWKRSYNGRDSLNIIEYIIDMDDITGEPGVWSDPWFKTYVPYYLGKYSRTKVLLLTQVIGMDPKEFTVLPTTTADKGKLLDKIATWCKYLYWWLGVEKQNGRTYTDENGDPITFGTLIK
ncbi:protein of unknown function [Chitinophaga jiangningensis]|uniref:DUF4843 domain-containing protein n=1 Tax=Chitinophaga jiangningensis TaxID=1419482 RepID=A0A1M6Y5L7_9BACT|nr:DUF4843 domain-containing protein [Chitinophaga jiangningensis]SHL13265.1 protein of unknown function [Chitinophaga jiangningensis]